MKKLMLLALLTFSTAAFAEAVEGEIFYKLPNGELVDRDVSLEVPARGQGVVRLKGDDFEWVTDNFWTERRKGKVIFYAAFPTQFREFRSTIVLKGSYLRGTNELVYYGDFYKKSGHGPVDSRLRGFEYGGGFRFDYDR